MQKVLSKNLYWLLMIVCFIQVSLISCKKDQPVTKTVTLQGKGETDLQVVTISEYGDATDPNAPEFGADAWTINGAPVEIRGLIKFDMSNIPAGAKINSAHLTVYSDPHPMNGDLVHANAGTNNSMFLQRVTSDWSLATKWTNQPTTDASTQIIIPHTDLPILNLQIDVTQMVQTMLSTNNYGWMFRLQNETYYNSRIFVGNRDADATKWPKLEVSYTK